jgi:putative ABC transport system permease protein
VKWLLTLCLPPGLSGQTMRGDLMEDFHEQAGRGDVRGARRRLRSQAIGLAWHYAVRRLRLLAPPFGHDLRLAARSIASQPVMSAAIVGLIGIALAANTALFSVFDGLLFRPLPYRDADRIVHLQVGPSYTALSGPERDAVKTRVRSSPLLIERADAGTDLLFDDAGPAYRDWGLRPASLSVSAFELLGVRPVLGRPFVESDSKDEPFAVLLGYDVWRTRFGGDPSIINQLVTIPGTSDRDRWRIVGVMPKGFSFPKGANFWVPVYPFWPAPIVEPYARLADGATLDVVRNALPHVTVTPLREFVQPDGATALGVLLGGTTLVLILAFVQVAALLFARASARTSDIGVRLALGASRIRLVRQFGVEALALVGLSLGLSAMLTPVVTALVVWLLPAELTEGQHVAPDVRAWLFGGAMATVGLLLFTLAPIELIRRSSPLGLLRAGHHTGRRQRATSLRSGLFVAQLALAVCLIYVSGLAARSYAAVGRSPLGFDTTRVVAIKMPRPDGPIRGGAPGESRSRLDAQRVMVGQTMDALRALPEVENVSGAHSWPLQPGEFSTSTLRVESDPNQALISVRSEWILRDYAATLGVALVRGAEPDPAILVPPRTGERRGPATYQALVNERLARVLEPFGDVVGQILIPNGALRFHITGVLPDMRLSHPDSAAMPTVFAYLPAPAAPGVVLARFRPGGTVETSGVQTVLNRLWGARAPVPLPLDDARQLAMTDYRARMFLLNAMTVLVMPLTLLGVAGALTHIARQRRREIAIQLAIGAEPAAIERQILRGTMMRTTIAVAVGLGFGVVVGRLVSSSLYGVRPADPATLATATVLIVAVSWCGALLPARRAGRISPLEILRSGE